MVLETEGEAREARREGDKEKRQLRGRLDVVKRELQKLQVGGWVGGMGGMHGWHGWHGCLGGTAALC